MISDSISDVGGKNVLITGGLGFIGSNLGRRLQQLGTEVNASDVRDVHNMRHLIHGIFNLAGQISHMDSMQDRYTDLEINCRAQLSILESCRHYNPSIRIVFASTRQIYGKPDHLPVNESRLLRPVDVNRTNKMPGWERKISLREGPQRTIEFYRMNLRHYP
jgi:UDP-glucose 4-epimerase